MTLAHGGKLKYRGNLPFNFDRRTFSYSGKLPKHIYNIASKGLYHKNFYVRNYFHTIVAECVCYFWSLTP